MTLLALTDTLLATAVASGGLVGGKTGHLDSLVSFHLQAMVG